MHDAACIESMLSVKPCWVHVFRAPPVERPTAPVRFSQHQLRQVRGLLKVGPPSSGLLMMHRPTCLELSRLAAIHIAQPRQATSLSSLRHFMAWRCTFALLPWYPNLHLARACGVSRCLCLSHRQIAHAIDCQCSTHSTIANHTDSSQSCRLTPQRRHWRRPSKSAWPVDGAPRSCRVSSASSCRSGWKRLQLRQQPMPATSELHMSSWVGAEPESCSSCR